MLLQFSPSRRSRRPSLKTRFLVFLIGMLTTKIPVAGSACPAPPPEIMLWPCKCSPLNLFRFLSDSVQLRSTLYLWKVNEWSESACVDKLFKLFTSPSWFGDFSPHSLLYSSIVMHHSVGITMNGANMSVLRCRLRIYSVDLVLQKPFWFILGRVPCPGTRLTEVPARTVCFLSAHSRLTILVASPQLFTRSGSSARLWWCLLFQSSKEQFTSRGDS